MDGDTLRAVGWPAGAGLCPLQTGIYRTEIV